MCWGGYKDAGQASANKEVKEGEDVEEGGSNEETPEGEKVHFRSVSSLVGTNTEVCGVQQVEAIGTFHETTLPESIIAAIIIISLLNRPTIHDETVHLQNMNMYGMTTHTHTHTHTQTHTHTTHTQTVQIASGSWSTH